VGGTGGLAFLNFLIKVYFQHNFPHPLFPLREEAAELLGRIRALARGEVGQSEENGSNLNFKSKIKIIFKQKMYEQKGAFIVEATN